MALRDTETFIREAAALYDPNIDVTPGSPFDVRVTQPLVRRLGNDPFTVDLSTFLSDRLAQAFPDLATSEVDVVADLLVKPVTVLWDPVVREVKRIDNLSFRDPSRLSRDEADALGANYFAPRRLGSFSRGVIRLFFTSPQNVSITPVNFFESKGGLIFFPTEVQSIRTQEMILNLSEDGLYYFDVNVIAEKTGAAYDIGPNEIGSVANLPAAVRVKNLRRFGSGENEENVAEYIGRVEQSLSERSLVTLRGIAAKTLNAFPEINRLNVVGFNDPEMQRDIIKGGGLGEIVAAGVEGVPVPDGEGKLRTRRFSVADDVDFFALISGEPSSWVLTVFQAFGAVPIARDLTVRTVISSTELDTEEQLFFYSLTLRSWTLRKRELTLSDIPGGILFPNGQNGTVTIPDGQVHIGGTYDVHVRGSGFEESTIAIDNVTDDEPLFRGSELEIATGPVIRLNDLVLDGTYVVDDSTYTTLQNSAFYGYSLQIIDGVDAGIYRILEVVQATGQPPELTVDPSPTNPGATLYRWRLFDAINVDLVNPKETRLEGEDLRTVQGTNIVDTASGLNLNDYGVTEGDTLRIVDGPDEGDFTITANPLAPSFDKLQLDRTVTQSRSALRFVIFRPNEGGGVQRPLIRITKVEILDSSNQPIGSTVPFAKPVDIQTRAFQNPARGVKHDIRDARLGLLSREADNGFFLGATAGSTLIFNVNGVQHTFALPTNDPPVDTLVSQINTAMFALAGVWQFAVNVTRDYLGIRPVYADVALVGGTARTAIFGNDEYRSVRDIRSEVIDEVGWGSLSPEIDTVSRLDVVQVLDGNNVDYYEAPFFIDLNMGLSFPFTDPSTALVVSESAGFNGFAPEVVRHVQIGARSLGSARVYFLEPTAFEVDDDSRFHITTSDGELVFLPDPTLVYQRIPALPSGEVPTDGSSTASGTVFTAASQDFIKSALRVGDNLEIENHPIAGSIVLPNPVTNLVNTTLIFSLDGGPDRTLTFIRDDSSLPPGHVSRDGVIDQINAAAGEEICRLTGSNTLEFETFRDLVIRRTGTANSVILGDVAGTAPVQGFSTQDQSNLSPHEGKYKIIGFPAADQVSVSPAFPDAASTVPFSSPITRQTFRVTRQGVQRTTASSMVDNAAEAGLYYFDVELISLGTGDQWNIDRGLQMTVSGTRSDGYYLTSGDSNTTFSSIEEIGLVLSRSILENGVDDDPQNATQLSGQNIQITYERAPLVNDLQSFIGSDVERVVCSSPLGRHLLPHFVRFDVNYFGGSREGVVTPEVEQYVRDLFPQNVLESSDVQKIILNRGATSITNPIDLIALVHYTDRTVYAARSQNGLTTGRLAAFIPDRINIKRSIT